MQSAAQELAVLMGSNFNACSY